MNKVTLKARGQQFEYSCASEYNAIKSSTRPVYSNSNRMPAEADVACVR